MGKHGRNNTANPVYTSYERSLDAKQEGYGTVSARLSKDSLLPFDCCALSLQPTSNPVVTPDGFIYDKEVIMENLLHQKREVARKLKEYEKQKDRFSREQAELEAAADRTKVDQFQKQQASIKSDVKDHFVARTAESGQASKQLQVAKETLKTVAGSVEAPLPSFWLPSLTPQAKETKLVKPDQQTRCPMSGKVLRLKDLIAVHFTPADSEDKQHLLTRQERWICPITKKLLRNEVPCAVLKPSGRVVTMECVERIIKPDMIDPISGDKLTDSDIILIKTAGTGFAGSGAELKKSLVNAAMLTA